MCACVHVCGTLKTRRGVERSNLKIMALDSHYRHNSGTSLTDSAYSNNVPFEYHFTKIPPKLHLNPQLIKCADSFGVNFGVTSIEITY